MKSRLDTLLSMMNCLQRKQNNMDIGEAMSMEFDGTDKLIKQEKKKFKEFLLEIQKEKEINA